MPAKRGVFFWQKMQQGLDWKLLVFLLLFLDVKLAIKIPAIVFIYILQFNFKFCFGLTNSRLPLFYLIAIGIAIINGLLQLHSANVAYGMVWLTGIGFWLMCILAIHQVKLAVERSSVEVIHRTIVVFFIINAVFSLFNLLAIIFEIHNINPYTYQGEYQKYFIGTGDYIKGITLDTSNTNAILSAIGVIYFLDKRKSLLLLICMATLLLTGSNFVNITLLVILLVIFIFKSTRDQKSLIAACMFMLVIFMAKISPQNDNYVQQTVEYVFLKKPKPVQPTPVLTKPGGNGVGYAQVKHTPAVLSPVQLKQHIAHEYLDSVNLILAKTHKAVPVVSKQRIIYTPTGRIITPGVNINAAPYQSPTVTPPGEQPLVDFINAHRASLPISSNDKYKAPAPGKILGMEQTAGYLGEHTSRLLLGAGMGNFSSKLAFKATGLGVSGGYPEKYVYINPAFMAKHLDLYLSFFSKRSGFHSLINSPFSVYDQIVAEYGLVGLLALLLFYFGYFASHYQWFTYGIPLLFLMAAVFFVDYWFEQLSVVPFFELMLFLNLKENGYKQICYHAHK